MSSVLLVKMSSLGDVVHTFAAVHDLKRQNPHTHLTWAVEEAYFPLVARHPAVDEVIPVPLRRLRQTSRFWPLSREWRDFIKTFRGQQYDLVIDAQGLLKSAFLLRQATTSTRCGFDWHSAREPLASLFYQQHFSIAKNQHAVTRSRQLFAQACRYSVDFTQFDFGLPRTVTTNQPPYLLFFHGSAWKSKTLPVTTWQQLTEYALAAGYEVYLPWGNEAEKQRAEKIAGKSRKCHVLPPLDLSALSEKIASSAGAISVDTGLGHLAGAFALPVLGVFGATSPAKSGILGQKSANIGGENPCYHKDCRQHGAKTENACMEKHSAEVIWRNWQQLNQT